MSTPPANADTNLLTRRQVHEVYGLTRVDVDRVFEQLPVTVLPGSRKVYVARDALDALLAEHTYAPGERVRRVA